MLKLCWSRHSLRRASPFTYHINIGNWGPVINLSEVLRAKKKKKVCLKPYMISKDDFSTILSMFIELFKKTEKNWALCSNVCVMYLTQTTADTFAIFLSQNWREFQLSNPQYRLDVTPCGRLGSLLPLNNSVGV